MDQDRIAVVQQRLSEAIASARPATRRLDPEEPIRPGTDLTAREALALFEAQATSRAIDVAARRLKARGAAYYTISSAGHEQNAVLGALLRPTDPCFLHYRSGALMMARARHDPASDPVYDALLGIVASSDDPVSGGRHKVWGSRASLVPPQTSTIASHLPKAMGMAVAIDRRGRAGLPPLGPEDAIVCCSFGDASINHATALAGINAARYAVRRGNPCPVLFVCEDNGRGISVDTPRRWIRETYGALPYLGYVEAAGDLDEVWNRVQAAIAACRTQRRPILLRLECVRLWGHAGSDVESGYRTAEEIARTEARDPLRLNGVLLVETGVARPEELLALLERVEERVRAAAERAVERPKLRSAAEVIEPLAPWNEDAVRADAKAAAARLARAPREDLFAGALPEQARHPVKRTLAARIGAALADALAARPEMLVFGEDVARKGGVYGVTQGLQRTFGRARVFDTLLDETTILGLAQGAAHAGFLPVPEIQYLAYLHNAIDQLRGEACSLSFFSRGQFTNPMVVRIAGLAYQKGFGGHFHNDNAVAALREIPGLAIAVGARGDDAVRLLRGSLAMASALGRVVVFLEPIALYHERDLYEAGDGGWLTDYPPAEEVLLPGEVGRYGPEDPDLLIVSYANGLRLSLRAAHRLEREAGLRTGVIDLRWLAPLPLDAVMRSARAAGRVLIVDECRASAGVADALVAALAEREPSVKTASVRSRDTYVPLGPAADLVLVGEQQIVEAARALASAR